MEAFFGSLAILAISGIAFVAWHAPRIYAFVGPLVVLAAILGSIWAFGFDHGLDRAAGIAETATSRAGAMKSMTEAKIYEWFDLAGLGLVFYVGALGLIAYVRDGVKTENAKEESVRKPSEKKDSYSTLGLLPKDDSDFGS